jgi:tripartite ATP-independent transporter DctM subunit
MSSIPLFILMGYLAANTGMAGDAFYAANKWVGHMHGGLAISTIIAGTIFGAVCGNIMAPAVTMCTVALPEMRKYGYSDQLSLGCFAASGTLSWLIPPSVGFIIYAILTELSIGQLFIAGILPGLLMSFLFIIAIFVWCRLNPTVASVGPKASWKERIGSLRLIWVFVVLILLVLGGIYGGIFTATEAAAIGVFGTMVLGLINRKLPRHAFTESIVATAELTGMIFLLIIGAMVFSSFMTVTQIPLVLANYMTQLSLSPWIILWMVLLVFIVIGFFMDIISVIMIVIPIIHPILVSLGFDPLLLGVLTVITILMGNISPPFGILVFVLAGVQKDVPLFTIFRGALPFLGAMFVCLVLTAAFPGIATILPHLMKG